jgi:glutamate synthase (NADPH/NADH) small chain
MGETGGFLTIPQALPSKRPVEVRLRDYREFVAEMAPRDVAGQAARCMDCGVPFCHQGCPLGNLIPEWNHLAYVEDWGGAAERLARTNPFPEFTSRICPAPCEPACVLAVNEEPVTIKSIERAITDRAFQDGHYRAEPPASRTGKRVAVIGSGPAGLAAAQELNRRGHWVTVYERADRLGGLLRYGIPDFKLEKWVVDRRIDLMSAEGVSFETGCDVGAGTSFGAVRATCDAVVVAVGAQIPRELDVPGRELAGVHLAMDYLEQQNRRVAGESIADDVGITARGKHVVILGGGDTGADCLGNVLREQCRSVVQLELMARPPDERAPTNLWPEWPLVFRTSPAHEEGGTRSFGILTTHLEGARGNVARLHGVHVDPEAHTPDATEPAVRRDVSVRADLVLLAMGYLHPVHDGLLDQLGASLDARGNLAAHDDLRTSVEGVFVAGDAHRGASLVVWAMAEGRRAALECDDYLSDRTPAWAGLADRGVSGATASAWG